jgi:2-dehydropantoate 2-reductase
VRIAVMGTGGVGGYFGALLARSGEDVHFIARGEHLNAIRASGLKVRSVGGDFVIDPAHATDTPSEIGPTDIVLFCVKTWDTESAARGVLPLLGPQTGVISFQNGVDNEGILAGLLGSEHVLGGVAHVTSSIGEAGVIVQTSAAARIAFGELDGRSTKRVVAFNETARAAGIDAVVSADIQKDIWTKWVFICAMAGVCTVARAPLGDVLSSTETRGLFIECMQEVAAVGRARGIRFDADLVDSQLRRAQALGPAARPSMLHDLEHGGRLELDSLNGAVVRLGAQYRVATPVNRFITAVLRPHVPPALSSEVH